MYRCARITIPSNDWGWAVSWIDKTQCELEIVGINSKAHSPKEIIPVSTQSIASETDEALRQLLTTARSGDTSVTGR